MSKLRIKVSIHQIIFWLSFFPIAIPIFFDFQDGSLVWPANSNEVYPEPGIPVPIGLLSFTLYFAYAFVNAIRRKSNFGFILSIKTRVILGIILSLVIFISILSGLGIFRIIQLLLPFLFIISLAVPEKIELNRVAIKYALTGALCFMTLHLISIFFNSENLLSPTSIEFTRFFSGVVYQSLVSYIAIVSLYFILAFWCYLAHIFEDDGFKIVLLIVIIETIILLLLGARRLSLLDLSVFVAFMGLLIMYRIITALRLNYRILLSVIVPVIMIIGLAYYFEVGMFERIENQIQRGRVAGGRFDIWLSFFTLVKNNPELVLVGFGGKGAPGFHNFFFDTIFRIGFTGVLLLMSGLIVIVWSLYRNQKLVNLDKAHFNLYKFFFVIIVMHLITNNLVNVAITQPLYFVNWIFVLMVFISRAQILQRINNSKMHHLRKSRESVI